MNTMEREKINDCISNLAAIVPILKKASIDNSIHLPIRKMGYEMIITACNFLITNLNIIVKE